MVRHAGSISSQYHDVPPILYLGSFLCNHGWLLGKTIRKRRGSEFNHWKMLRHANLGRVICPTYCWLYRRQVDEQRKTQWNPASRWCGLTLLGEHHHGSGHDVLGIVGIFHLLHAHLALVNTITFQNVRDIEGDFPKVRLWGTIGWIIAGLTVSQSFFGLSDFPILPGIEDAGGTAVQFQLAAVVSAIYGVFSFTLPASPPEGRGKSVNLIKVLGFDALSLLLNPSYLVFAISSFLICIPLAFYYARTGDFVNVVHFGESTGGVMALGQVSEIFFMALVPFFLIRLGVKKMLLVGMLCWALRYALFGLMPSSAALVVLGIAVHGICYDFFFVTGQLYTDRVAPKDMRTNAKHSLGFSPTGLACWWVIMLPAGWEIKSS